VPNSITSNSIRTATVRERQGELESCQRNSFKLTKASPLAPTSHPWDRECPHSPAQRFDKVPAWVSLRSIRFLQFDPLAPVSVGAEVRELSCPELERVMNVVEMLGARPVAWSIQFEFGLPASRRALNAINRISALLDPVCLHFTAYKTNNYFGSFCFLRRRAHA